MPRPGAERLPEIDWLKGLAILGVVCVHSLLLYPSPVFVHLINRGVPTFLFAFGITSELWWQREVVRAPEGLVKRWYAQRLRRLLPGYWALTAIWWLCVVLGQRPPSGMQVGPIQALVSLLGYAPWIGTTWFFAMVLQFVAVFPLLRWLTVRAGAVLSLSFAAVVTLASVWFAPQITAAQGAVLGRGPGLDLYHYWIFAPRVLWHVVAGIFVARWWGGKVELRTTLGALAMAAFGTLIAALWSGRSSAGAQPNALVQWLDVPFALALLGLLRLAWLPGPALRFLAWCGLWSWGIYLGHILLHDLLQMAGFAPFFGRQPVRAVYALGLLAGGSVLAVVAERVSRAVSPRVARWNTSSAA